MAVKKASVLSWLCFFVLLTIGSALLFDILSNENFKSSTTARYLKDTGALHYGELGLEQAKIYSQRGIEWTRENGPHYYAVTLEYSKPYLLLMQDMGYITYNALSEAYSVFDQWFTENAPDLSSNVKRYRSIVIDHTQQIFHDVVEYSKVGYTSIQDYAAKNIFVGTLSPENLKKYTHEAVNATLHYTKWTYQWIVQQVDSVNKVN